MKFKLQIQDPTIKALVRQIFGIEIVSTITWRIVMGTESSITEHY